MAKIKSNILTEESSPISDEKVINVIYYVFLIRNNDIIALSDDEKYGITIPKTEENKNLKKGDKIWIQSLSSPHGL